MPTSKQPLEPQVAAEVYDAAMARAKSQGQTLAAVARTVLFQEAARTPEGSPVPDGQPPRRPYQQPRKPIKFKVDREAYLAARDRIAASGRSVASAIEDGLVAYARTGRVENHVPIDIPTTVETR